MNHLMELKKWQKCDNLFFGMTKDKKKKKKIQV